jgi:hypothetical protein
MRRWLTIAGLFGLAGCGATAPSRPPVAATVAVPAKSAAAAATISCVDLSRIREARVVDDRTIDFYVGNHEVLRNTLPNLCSQLGFERAFTYSTSLSKLCSGDIITVIVQGGGVHTGSSCGLGAFVPYTPIPK